MEVQYWVQVDGGTPYTTDDSGRLWAMLYGVLIGTGEPNHGAHKWATNLVDQAVKEQVGHVEEMADGRTLRLSIVRLGEVEG